MERGSFWILDQYDPSPLERGKGEKKEAARVSSKIARKGKRKAEQKKWQQQKETLVNIVHNPKKRKKVDRSVLVIIWNVNDYNVESRYVALFEAVIMELWKLPPIPAYLTIKPELNSKIMKRSTYSQNMSWYNAPYSTGGGDFAVLSTKKKLQCLVMVCSRGQLLEDEEVGE